jgi:hypothetical protein
MRPLSRTWLFLVLMITVRGAFAGDFTAPGVTLTAGDPSGIAFKPLERLEVGDSLSVAVQGARPRATVELLLQDDRGKEWSYSRVHSDARGNVPQTLFWYQSGVIGTTTRRVEFRPDPAFIGFDEAERFFETNALHLTVRESDGRVLATRTFRPGRRGSAFVYPSNAQGVLENAVNARDEDLYASGRNFPAGAKVQLFLVPNRFGWAAGDPFAPVREAAKTIQLAPGQTSFTTRLLSRRSSVAGSYDIIARVGGNTGLVVSATDIISFGEDTGVVLYYIIINGNIVIDSAGRMKASPAYFEFSDAFEKGEDVYAAVDPTDVPDGHAGGSYAAYWTVAHQQPAYWDGPAPPLVDVSGDGPEIHRVKYFCINGTRVRIWTGATQAAPIAAYDVIVDFGAVPADTSADYVFDNTYTKQLDFIDGYQTEGFWVFEDPGAAGPTPVGTVELLEPNGISGITDPSGVTGPTEPVTLAWARIKYPATAAGTGTPVAAGGPYPVALFLHGRHWRCDNDGSGPGLSGGFNAGVGCPQNQRIPSHEGYNYIMDRLASHGVFCISINAYDIQAGLGKWDYDARGRLVLKFLDKLRDWTNNGTDPFGLFNGQIDMSRVVLSGHSRGGEGVVAAQSLNATWPNPHSILGVNAIAPTEQDPNVWYVPTSSYFLLLGARDGDVSSMQGYRTYDRAFPNTMMNRKPKAVAWVYGANHNFYNTIWTPDATNPWAGSVDDCQGCPQPALAQTPAVQQQVALSTISAFFRWQLQGIAPYREILTGRVQPAAMDNGNVFWTFQDASRDAIDDFEQQPPQDPNFNTVNGMVSAVGFSKFQEILFNQGLVLGVPTTWYDPALAADHAFMHDTLGLQLAWPGPLTYTTDIPAGPHRNVSAYTHLTMRVAKKVTGAQVVGPDVVLYVNIEDSMGHKAAVPVPTSNYGRIPHPFAGALNPNQAVLSGIRIPLMYFTKNNSQVDLTDISRITISTEGSAEIGIDDIEFGK